MVLTVWLKLNEVWKLRSINQVLGLFCISLAYQYVRIPAQMVCVFDCRPALHIRLAAIILDFGCPQSLQAMGPKLALPK